MTGVAVRIGVGTRFQYDGEVVTVVELVITEAGNEVVLRNAVGQLIARVALRELLVSDRVTLIPDSAGEDGDVLAGPATMVLAELSEGELQQVAGWTGEAGNPTEATRRYTELIPDCVRVLGSDNPLTLECRRHLALYTENAGDTGKALRLYTELLPDCARALGPDHPETLLCHQALARLA